MAIKVFSRGNQTSTSLSLLYDFLVSNQQGTFLENMTITRTEAEGSNRENIVIASANASCKIQLYQRTSGTPGEVFRYTANGYYYANTTYVLSSQYYSACYLYSVILCDKGLIFDFRGLYNNTSSSYNYVHSVGIGLTVDNNGELACLRTTDYLPAQESYNMRNTEWQAISATSTTGMNTRIVTRFGTNRTALAPIPTLAENPDEYLPYAYAAIASQVANEGLQSVLINGKAYITNGVWYIKDGD